MIPNLFRIFFPTWRFFEDLTPIPKILIRWQNTAGNHWSPWSPLPKAPPERHWRQLFHNPEVNLQMALQVQVEQLLNDIALMPSTGSEIPLAEMERLPSYQIILSYVLQEVQSHWPLERRQREQLGALQFKIGALEFLTDKNKTIPRWEDSLQSPFLEL